MTATMNGAPQRKQLSAQLDRLDGIIDLLADNLNQAVADAAREGARLAVKEAIVEVLSNPDLRGLLARPPAPPKPTTRARLKAGLAGLRARAVAAARPALETAAGKVRAVTPAVVTAARLLGLAWEFRAGAAAALGVGAATAAVCYAAPHGVSAAVAGAGGAVAAAAVRAGLWVRAASRALHLA